MGYTHYWRKPKKLDQTQFSELVADMKVVIANLPDFTNSAGACYPDKLLKIAEENDVPDKKPVLKPNLIRFNGTSDKGEDLGHETFYFDRIEAKDASSDKEGLVFSFCKTARKPYDLVVTAALILIKNRFPEIEVSSDGDADDWSEGLKLVKKLFPDRAIKPHQPFGTFEAAKAYYLETKDKDFAPEVVEAWANA